MSEIEERVMKVVGETLGVNREEIHLESNFFTDLGADQLDSVELVRAFEQEFGIQIPDEDVEKLTTVRAVVEYLSQGLN